MQPACLGGVYKAKRASVHQVVMAGEEQGGQDLGAKARGGERLVHGETAMPHVHAFQILVLILFASF